MLIEQNASEAAVSEVDPAVFDDIESIGDNCELGFALHRVGNERTTLLRWAQIPTVSLLTLLRHSLADTFLFDELKPVHEGMVMDRFGIGWHSAMRSDASLCFVHPEEERRAIFEQERGKYLHQVEKFRQRLAGPRGIFVVKNNAGIADEQVLAIQSELERLSGRPRWLMVARPADADHAAGATVQVAPYRIDAFISRFAPYHAADDIDLDSWRPALLGALEIAG